MNRLTLASLALSAVVLTGCLGTGRVPPDQRRDDQWRQTSEMLSRPPTENF